jgi:hypothetical protein
MQIFDNYFALIGKGLRSISQSVTNGLLERFYGVW